MPDSTGRQALPVILDRLKSAYPNARYELNWETPLQLLVATILAAQCTDERVNSVTASLFKKYADAHAYANAKLQDLIDDLRTISFPAKKAEAIQGACQAIIERYGGEVPRSMEALLTLPRVARKTANVVLTNAYRIPSGVVVDTHVERVCRRLGLSTTKAPEKMEQELMQLLPESEWIQFGGSMVLHGRYTCTDRNPKCSGCIVDDVCPKIGVNDDGEKPEVPTTKKVMKQKTAPKPQAHAEPAAQPAPSGSLVPQLPADWQQVLAAEFQKPYWQHLQAFVAEERKNHTVFPPEEDVFNALKLTPYEKVKVLLLGQDPYHDNNQAHGLCFSVRPGIKPPPSLVNMFKELHGDLGCRIPNHGYLVPWAEQGILLLNAVLTVRAHEANSHKDKGWETFTDAVIKAVNDRKDPVVFVLWGNYAQKKIKLIDAARHRILTAAHPSPLSVKKFFGSRPFSAINKALKELGHEPIDWQLPDLEVVSGEW